LRTLGVAVGSLPGCVTLPGSIAVAVVVAVAVAVATGDGACGGGEGAATVGEVGGGTGLPGERSI
jgi:hypothetical protein